MKNFIEEGEALTFSNTGAAIASGDVVPLGTPHLATITAASTTTGGGRIGVATTNIAATTGVGALAMKGVFDLPLKSGDAPAQGDTVFWDATNKYITVTAASNYRAGKMWAAGSDATHVAVDIGR